MQNIVVRKIVCNKMPVAMSPCRKLERYNKDYRMEGNFGGGNVGKIW